MTTLVCDVVIVVVVIVVICKVLITSSMGIM